LDVKGNWLALIVKVQFFVFISLRDLLHDLKKTKQNKQLVKEPFAWSLLSVKVFIARRICARQRQPYCFENISFWG